MTERTTAALLPGRDARILADLLSPGADLDAIARRHFSGRGSPLRRLASWASRPRSAAALSAVQALADGRARLVVSRARADAAGALLALALDREDKELARKACVDLLKLDPGEAPAPPAFGPGGPGGPGGAPDSAAMDAGAVRSLLEKLGARSEPVSGGGTP